MVAVIKGDIIASRKLVNQAIWLTPLKNLLATWGSSPRDWKITAGDYFQLELANPESALKKALEIKALIKKVEPLDAQSKMSTLDVRLAIGIGEKTYSGETIDESNGPAFHYSSDKFAELKKDHVTLSIKTPWEEFNEEMNLYLKLAGTFMDQWSVASAEIVQIVLQNPHITQEEIGQQIGIKQNSVSGRWSRAHVKEILEIESMFRKKIKSLRT